MSHLSGKGMFEGSQRQTNNLIYICEQISLSFKVNEKNIRIVSVDVFLVFFIEYENIFAHGNCLAQQTFTFSKSTMGSTRERYDICSKLTIKSLLLTSNILHTFFYSFYYCLLAAKYFLFVFIYC